ncbi:hypothetical protein [Acidithiobacillus concretivorus]|uniref:Uncharacterized protein n=1 Tax=Acidithiobacillus concretivorus TaxID=3063952 RepID=A0ABS5ZTH3_9PROT|nr:hypothetical protein [Acidithiobacillus concretivorus]MBU2739987.1 hypothetical protein [Acidithiobacillus concretivorus]
MSILDLGSVVDSLLGANGHGNGLLGGNALLGSLVGNGNTSGDGLLGAYDGGLLGGLGLGYLLGSIVDANNGNMASSSTSASAGSVSSSSTITGGGLLGGLLGGGLLGSNNLLGGSNGLLGGLLGIL